MAAAKSFVLLVFKYSFNVMGQYIAKAEGFSQGKFSICLAHKKAAFANLLQVNKIRLNNLLILIEEFGSQAALADRISVSPGYITQLKNGERPITEKTAEKITKALGKRAGWMDQDHTGVNEDRSTYNVHPGPDSQGMVPLISWVQAGDWCEAINQFHPGDAESWLPCPSNHSSHTYALRVSGDSMTAPFGRSYPNGCMIYVDPDQRGGVVSGDRVIAKVNGDNLVTFKVFVEDAGTRFLRPLNAQYPVITQPFRLLGKVIGMYMPE